MTSTTDNPQNINNVSRATLSLTLGEVRFDQADEGIDVYHQTNLGEGLEWYFCESLTRAEVRDLASFLARVVA